MAMTETVILSRPSRWLRLGGALALIAIVLGSLAASRGQERENDLFDEDPREFLDEEEIDEEEVLEFIDKRLPELTTRLRQFEDDDPEMADELRERILEIYEEYRFLAEEFDDDLAESFLIIQQLEFKLDASVERFLESDDLEEREAIRKQLVDVLDELFERRLRIDRVQMEGLRRELIRFEREIEHRERNRRSILEERLVEILEDIDDEGDQFEDDEDEFEEEDDEEEFESPRDYLEEMRAERERLGIDRRNLERQLGEIRLREEFLEQAIARRRAVVEAFDTIERAERDGDSDQVDQAIAKFELLSDTTGREDFLAELQLDLAVLNLESDQEEGDEAEQEDASGDRREQIASLLTKLIGLMERLVAEELPDPLERDYLDEEMDELQGQLSLIRELAEREADLREARERGDTERVEFLEEIIRELRIEAGELEEEPEPDEDEEGGANADDPGVQAALPVVLTPEDLALAQSKTFDQHARPILMTYCIDCHGNGLNEGNLDIEALLEAPRPLVRNRERWRNVMEQVRNRAMPPNWAIEPEESERKVLLAHLNHEIVEFDYESVRDPGYVPARRLSHVEYDRTVRDLFGVDGLQPSKRFPDDLSGPSGFTNSAETLFLQPLLMESYLAAAEDVVTQALGTEPRNPSQQAARDRLFVAEPGPSLDEAEAARIVLDRFLRRAWRQPTRPEDASWVLELFREVRPHTKDFRSAIVEVLPAVLASPRFLLHREPVPSTGEVTIVDNHTLANRLSYFLWASMPDDRLFELADQGLLTDPDQLRAEVRRMVDDPKADALGAVFAGQWLGFDRLGIRNRPDPIDNAWATDTLIESLQQESALFVESLIRDDQPITKLVDADYTYMNEEISRFYRVRGIQGPEMRRVPITDEVRGGLLGQASILALTSFQGRTSPVVRGHWILDTLLGTPPPPPPPNVSQLNEEVEENDRLSFRQKLEVHRKNPNCSACHSQMDPLGFSLEGFDWFGRYRPRREDGRVDDRGQLPNGTRFRGPQGLKAVLIAQRSDDLIRQVTQKMLTFALGRQLDYRDEATVREIVAHVRSHDDRFSPLIDAIVLSEPFRFVHRPQPESRPSQIQETD